MRRAKVLRSRVGGLTLAAICLAGPVLADEKASADDLENAFARLKSLVGTWKVEEASVGGETYEDTRTVVYELTGKGSALVEQFYGESSMASVYHMDGAELRLTHYCSAGNQPRMNAVSYDAEKGVLKFDFVDVANLSSPTAYHTRHLEIVFQDEDHVQLRFNGLKEGKEVPLIMSLKRQRSPIGEKGVSKDYEAAFARLKTLVGTWDVQGGNSERVDYYLTGKDSALVERFGGGRGMATVYHMDGDDIRMTHYCSAKNQPRMKASRYDAENGILKFDFVDVTNLSKPTAYHTRELEIVFQDEDHIQLKFNGLHEGEEVPVTQSLTRRQ